MASETRPAGGDRIARNTAIFSVATGLSRVAGLVREIVASGYFGTSGAFSAFTVAFQVPNLVRNLFADSALSAAFVPVFTDLLVKEKRRDAFLLASTLAAVPPSPRSRRARGRRGPSCARRCCDAVRRA